MVCQVCNGRFEENELCEVHEDYPYGERYVQAASMAVCPYCGSDEIVDEATCEECREDFPETELEDGLCHTCLEELRQTLEWVRSMLSPAQLRWAAEHPEWTD